jgi:hypothetical protein
MNKEFLEHEKQDIQNAITTLEIDIAVMERSDPMTVLARKQLTDQSYREITVSDMINSKKSELEGKKIRLSVVEKFIKSVI